ncbi:hypothetical protein ABK905_10885 [Acerihabitans sp. KWT182]|uniref:Uncharacterized protein n=1 Tax=Acerihabitans sp. KWT182 TaxID=3157919 RepID=A0AAU7QGE0_9GAMM
MICSCVVEKLGHSETGSKPWAMVNTPGSLANDIFMAASGEAKNIDVANSLLNDRLVIPIADFPLMMVVE